MPSPTGSGGHTKDLGVTLSPHSTRGVWSVLSPTYIPQSMAGSQPSPYPHFPAPPGSGPPLAQAPALLSDPLGASLTPAYLRLSQGFHSQVGPRAGVCPHCQDSRGQGRNEHLWPKPASTQACCTLWTLVTGPLSRQGCTYEPKPQSPRAVPQ